MLVVVHHLAHFLIKRNLSEKNSPRPGFKPGTSSSLYQLSYSDIVIKVIENYLLKDFKNHAADLGPVLVDTCFFLVMAKQKADQQFVCFPTANAKSLPLMASAHLYWKNHMN